MSLCSELPLGTRDLLLFFPPLQNSRSLNSFLNDSDFLHLAPYILDKSEKWGTGNPVTIYVVVSVSFATYPRYYYVLSIHTNFASLELWRSRSPENRGQYSHYFIGRASNKQFPRLRTFHSNCETSMLNTVSNGVLAPRQSISPINRPITGRLFCLSRLRWRRGFTLIRSGAYNSNAF